MLIMESTPGVTRPCRHSYTSHVPTKTQPKLLTYPFAPLLRWLRDTGRKQSEIARDLDESPQTLTNWKARGIPKSELLRVAGVMGITAEEYLARAGLLDRGVAVQRESRTLVAASPAPDSIAIPKLLIRGSMGYGNNATELETIAGTMELTRAWVRSHLPSISAPHHLRIITGWGDSMDDTYRDGDLLLVDTGVSEIVVDGVYVFRINSDVFIKRIQRRPDGSLLILSDNKRYEPYVIDSARRGEVAIAGRVVWAWNGRRL